LEAHLIAQLDNKVISSFLLWMDHRLTSSGQAYTNHSSRFYDISNQFSSFDTYALPFQPLVSDSSIPGATVMSGVYINGVYNTTGSSGLYQINYDKGQIILTGNPAISSISGLFAIKDFNYKLTSASDVELLFETKYKIKSTVTQTLSGLASDEVTIPVIFVRDNGGKNEGAAFGGMDKTTFNVRVVIVADSQFLLDATSSNLRDTNNLVVPLLQPEEYPYNSYGGLKYGTYNYNTLTVGKGADLYIDSVFINKLNQNVRTDVSVLNPSTYVGFVDFELCSLRFPRR
jgi:hypothetical protein